MAKSTFVGGIHPYEGKELSKDKPIRAVLPKGELVYPLSQHIGAPASPIVQKGDHVLQGQKIAEASGFVSAPIYATVSGTVKAIEPRRVVTSNEVMSIVLENDGLYEEVEYPVHKPYEELGKEEIIAIVKEAGIVGMGGAGFPTFIKLSPKEPDKIDYVIANCAECEPYLTSDYRRMIEEPEKLIGGLKIMLRLFDHAKGILADRTVKKADKGRAGYYGDAAKDKVSPGIGAFHYLCHHRQSHQFFHASGGRRLYRGQCGYDRGHLSCGDGRKTFDVSYCDGDRRCD